MISNFSLYLQLIHLTIILLLFGACSHGPVTNKKHALIPLNHSKIFSDDLPFDSLKKAMKDTIEKLELTADDSMIEYPVTFSMIEYKKILIGLNKCSKTKKQFLENVENFFDPFMTFGKDRFGEILLTSYYEPLLSGSKTQNKRHSMPIYKAPENLVEIKLDQFSEDFFGEIDTNRKVISAQLTEDKFGNKQIIPLPSREDIDFKSALKNKNLEIAFVDPIDAFFLHIQGSGRILFENGESFTVGYHAQNGMKYEPIGKFLVNEIPKEKMSLQTIEQVLRTKYHKKLIEILPLNPSYIFFKKIDGRAKTTIGAEVTNRRTLAVDTDFFNLGLLGHLIYPELEITESGALEKENRYQHFVLNQDTGGAIKSTGRADLFWGSGENGKKMAGHMRHLAQLTYFLPKQKTLEDLRAKRNFSCSK